MSDNEPKIRVAFIGCGRIASLHANGYANNPQCEIVALSDISPEATQAFAEKHGYANAKHFTDHKKMLKAVKPDLVSICLWTHLHHDVVLDCVAAKVKAIHCEKPMAPCWGDAVEMETACRKAGVQLTFNHQRRFLPLVKEAKRILDRGSIGKLQLIEAYVPDNVIDWGTHIIDMAHMFNDETPAKWVMGQLDTREPGQWFGIPFEYACLGWVYFENGVRALIESGKIHTRGPGFILRGSAGTIEITDRGPHLHVNGIPVAVPGCLHDTPDQNWAGITGVIKNVTDCLATGAEPELAAARALRATEVIFAIYKSARDGGRIDLPLKDLTLRTPDALGLKPIKPKAKAKKKAAKK